MNEYAPDYWQVIKIVHRDEIIYKLFSSWVGGYLNGDSWKLNSGITGIKKVGTSYEITGYSGSVYTVPANDHCYRTTAYTSGILQSIIDKTQAQVEVLPCDTNWENLV